MRKPALRRATKSTLLLVISALLFLAGLAGTTFAYFDGETDNVGTYSGGYVFAPTLATTSGVPVGGSQTITWTTPTTTGVQNYVIRGTNMGTTASPSCPAQTVVTTTITTPAATTPATVTLPTTYPDTVATLAAPALTGVATNPAGYNGSWICYQVAANWTPATWYSKNSNANATGVREGLWPTAVAIANVATSGSMANTDTITITYNQNVSASGTVSVCARSVGAGTGIVFVGDTSSCAGTGDSFSIAKITGVTIGTSRNFPTSAISKPAANQVRVTLGGASGTSTYSGTDTWVNGGTTVTSSSSPTISPCTGANCNVAPSGAF